MPAARLRHLIVALVLIAPTAAWAAHVAVREAEPAPIHACARVKDGRLRLVASAARCRRRERAVSWNVAGPPGPAGPAGPTGVPGEQGPAGERGEAGRSVTSLEDLAGLGCHAGGREGTVSLTYDTAGRAAFTCVTTGSADGASVRVNELATGTTASLTDEFVELVNAGAKAADIGGYRLVYRSRSGTSDIALATVPEGTTLAAGAFYLFGGSGYAGATPADQSFTAGLASTAGGIGLRDPAGTLVDSVGYGTAANALVEGNPAPAPSVTAPPGSSGVRLPDGRDTDDNAADFAVTSVPTPGGPNRGG
jgi:Lamin Tail Domain